MKCNFLMSLAIAIVVFLSASFIIGTEQWEKAMDDINSRSVVTDSDIVQVNKKYGFNCDIDECPTLFEFIKVGAASMVNI